ncbi:MAG: BadF/BadG/BcrA/BcrD ATPase family protein [Thermoanaerobaculia bacterium]
MRCVVGIDLGSTTTKAVLVDEAGEVVGRGITNSRSNYEVASAVARDEALTAARFEILERAVGRAGGGNGGGRGKVVDELLRAFRLEIYLEQLAELRKEILGSLAAPFMAQWRQQLEPAVEKILEQAEDEAPQLFAAGAERRSDFFRDIAGAAYTAGAERAAREDGVPFDRAVSLFDRAILDVETRLLPQTFADRLRRAAARVRAGGSEPADLPLPQVIDKVVATPIEEQSFVGTGYGRQTLPFPKQAVRSEILCHGRGAYNFFPGTRTPSTICGRENRHSCRPSQNPQHP